MPESEEAPKIVVRTPNGDLWLISSDAIPQKVHSQDPNLQPQDATLVNILDTTNTSLADHFGSANPGVRVGITVVDFD
jgi:hypothetical protein